MKKFDHQFHVDFQYINGNSHFLRQHNTCGCFNQKTMVISVKILDGLRHVSAEECTTLFSAYLFNIGNIFPVLKDGK